jgi:hypothetical protein
MEPEIHCFPLPTILRGRNYSGDLELVEQTRPCPFEPRRAVLLALAALIPIVPLLATIMPMEEVFELLSEVLKWCLAGTAVSV